MFSEKAYNLSLRKTSTALLWVKLHLMVKTIKMAKDLINEGCNAEEIGYNDLKKQTFLVKMELYERMMTEKKLKVVNERLKAIFPPDLNFSVVEEEVEENEPEKK